MVNSSMAETGELQLFIGIIFKTHFVSSWFQARKAFTEETNMLKQHVFFFTLWFMLGEFIKIRSRPWTHLLTWLCMLMHSALKCDILNHLSSLTTRSTHYIFNHLSLSHDFSQLISCSELSEKQTDKCSTYWKFTLRRNGTLENWNYFESINCKAFLQYSISAFPQE